MPSDASIYSMIRPPAEQPGPMDMMAKQLQLKHLIDSGQLSALQRQQLEKSIAEEDATGAAYRESGGDPTKLRDLLYGRGLYKPAQAAEKTILERQKSEADLKKTQVETFSNATKALRDQIAQLAPGEDTAPIREATMQLFGPDVGAKMIARYPATVTPDWQKKMMFTADEQIKRLSPAGVNQDQGGTVGLVDPYTNAPIGPRVQKTATPGEVLADSRSRDANAGKQGLDQANIEGKIRDDYTNASKPFVTVRDAHQRVIESAKDPSAAGDLALIFNYMKVLDPGSTVREGEFATAQNAAGVSQRIMAQYNKVINGERLAEGQRADFLDRSGRLYKAAETNQAKLEGDYEGIAKRSGARPENVVIKNRVVEPKERPKPGQPTQAEIDAELRRRGVIQ